MNMVECKDCGEEYPPVATHWICPSCGIDDNSQPKVAVFQLKED